MFKGYWDTMVVSHRRQTRDVLKVCVDMLTVARDGARKTHIMYKANLSYEMLNRYLELLDKAGLLMFDGSGTFAPTEKGLMFLKHYMELVRSATEYRTRNANLTQLLSTR